MGLSASGTSPRGIAAVLAGLSLATPARAQDQFDVVGIVADSSGAALNGAMISPLALPDSALSKLAPSKGSGAFTLKRLRACDYVLQVTMLGPQTPRTDFTVTDGNVDAGRRERAQHRRAGMGQPQ